MVRMSFHHAEPQKNKLERLLMGILTMMMILIVKRIQYWWWHSRYAASDKVHRHCTAGLRSDFFATTLLKLSCSSCIRFPRGERRTEKEKLTFPYHHHHHHYHHHHHHHHHHRHHRHHHCHHPHLKHLSSIASWFRWTLVTGQVCLLLRTLRYSSFLAVRFFSLLYRRCKLSVVAIIVIIVFKNNLRIHCFALGVQHHQRVVHEKVFCRKINEASAR